MQVRKEWKVWVWWNDAMHDHTCHLSLFPNEHSGLQNGNRAAKTAVFAASIRFPHC